MATIRCRTHHRIHHPVGQLASSPLVGEGASRWGRKPPPTLQPRNRAGQKTLRHFAAPKPSTSQKRGGANPGEKQGSGALSLPRHQLRSPETEHLSKQPTTNSAAPKPIKYKKSHQTTAPKPPQPTTKKGSKFGGKTGGGAFKLLHGTGVLSKAGSKLRLVKLWCDL